MDFVSDRIRILKPYTAGEQIESIIKLNTNENPYPPTPKIKKKLESLDIAKLKLYPDQNSNMVKDAIAKRFNVSSDMVFMGNGSDEILAFVRPAFFDGEGEKLAYADITYSFYPVYDQLYRVQTVIVPVKEDFSVDLTEYDNLPVKGYLFANPNAPTSIAIPKDEMEDFIRRHPDRLVIIDEAYIDFCDESVIGLTKKYDNLLVIRTLSKGYSLAGIRCGFAVGCKALIDGLKKIKDSFNNYPVDYIAEIVAAEAVKDADYYQMINAKVVNTRKRTVIEMKELGFSVLPSSSNFIFVTHGKFKAEELYQKLKAEKILIRHFNKERIDNYLRITIGTDKEMDYFLERLSKIINA